MGPPVRTCAGCRRARPQADLIRVARRPDGTVLPDRRSERGQGRGAYICRDRSCVERACRSGGLKRALRLDRGLPPGLEEELLMVVEGST